MASCNVHLGKHAPVVCRRYFHFPLPFSIERWYEQSTDKTSKKRTLWLWKIFTTIYPWFRDNGPTYNLTAYRPKNPLAQYFELMNEDDCAWGATLVVAPSLTDAHNLVSIANIKNLVGLEISTYQRNRGYIGDPDEHKGDLEDKVVRSWMEMALQDGCLQHLRILRFAHQHRITPNILWMLGKLPALELIVIHDCPMIVQDGRESRSRGLKHRHNGRATSGARIHGWKGHFQDQVPVEYYKENSLRPLGSLAEICRIKGMGERVDFPPRSNDLSHLRRPTTPSLERPLLSFELQETERHSACFAVGADDRSNFVFHRDGQPSAKRADDGENAPGHRQKRKKGPERDLSGLLGEFMG